MRERGWFVVLSSAELKKKPVAARRFGRDLVFFRDAAGVAQALVDLCPHRRTKLSLGQVKGDCITCPFHGFTFDGSGACTSIPQLGPGGVIPQTMRAEAVHLREVHGFIFAWGDSESEPVGEPAWFIELTDRFSYGEFTADWATHYSRAIENQLDFAHLPFVHATTIGRGMSVQIDHTMQEEPGRIRYQAIAQGRTASDDVFVEWRAPNVWLLSIAPGFKNMVAFAPVDDGHTRLYLRAYQSFMRVPGLKQIVNALTSVTNNRVLLQDQAVVEMQTPQITALRSDEVLLAFDRPIIAFRRQRETWSSAPDVVSIGRRARSAEAAEG